MPLVLPKMSEAAAARPPQPPRADVRSMRVAAPVPPPPCLAGEELLCAAAASWLVGVWPGPGAGGRHRHVPVQVRR
jgi:hypothetical protein